MPRSQPAKPDSSGEGRRPSSNPAFLVLGQITRPHGIRGELRVLFSTAFPDRVSELETVYVGRDPYDPATAQPYELISSRRHQDTLLVRLAGIDSREAADAMRDKLLLVALEDAVPLEEGEYYLFQIIGAQVVTTEGEELGRVAEVLETGANDVIVVRGGLRGEILLPDIPEVILKVDIEHARVTVALLPGLLSD